MSTEPQLKPLSFPDETQLTRSLPREGEHGIRYRAVSVEGGRRVALWAAHHPGGDAEAESFRRSAERRAEARANRLLPVVVAGSRDDWHWVAYECGPAVPLSSHEWHKWPAGKALGLIVSLSGTLDELAEQGVAPSELLPNAIFMEPRLGPLLADLGTAREAFGAALAEPEYDSAFAPPEVLGGKPAGGAASVYAAAALLHILLSGKPPGSGRVARRRPDLPEELDAVLARALASDPLERHATVAELCESATHAFAGHSSRQRPRATAPRAKRARAESPRPAPRAALVAAAAAVTLGAFGGMQVASPSTSGSDAGVEVTGDQISMRLPPGWLPGVTREHVVLSAYPSEDWSSGLSVRRESERVIPEDQTDPVRLGELDAWRDRSRAPSSVRYSVPTRAGALLISCDASPGSPEGLLSLCERAVSTVRLEDDQAVPLPGVVERPGLRAAATSLARQRSDGRRALARADAPGAQRRAAASLSRTYRRAAARLNRVPQGAALAAASRRTAAAYAAMARAARHARTARWNDARAAVRRHEAVLARLLRGDE